MYKDKKYRVRRLREILDDIRMAKDYYGDVEKVFLCDGDAIAIETETLLQILQALYATFPSLRHVGSYVGPQSTLTKSPDELRVLRSAGLTKAYIGVETGDDELLKRFIRESDAPRCWKPGAGWWKPGSIYRRWFFWDLPVRESLHDAMRLPPRKFAMK